MCKALGGRRFWGLKELRGFKGGIAGISARVVCVESLGPIDS